MLIAAAQYKQREAAVRYSMDRRIDTLTAQRIRTAQAARRRVDTQTMARELLLHGVKLETAGRVLATSRRRQSDTILTDHS